MAEELFDEGSEPLFPDDSPGDDSGGSGDDAPENPVDHPGYSNYSQEDIEAWQESHRIVSQFNADPNAALNRIAQSLGKKIVDDSQPAVHQQDQQQASGGSIDAIRTALQNNPELMPFAEPLAKAVDSLVNQRMAPIEEDRQRQQVNQRQQEAQNAIDAFSRQNPEWRNHARQEDLAERWKFVQEAANGGPMVHPKFGNIVEMLFGWETGNRFAEARAGRRMARAARNQIPSTSGSGEVNTPNIQEQIGKAGSFDEKCRIAFKAALEESGF